MQMEGIFVCPIAELLFLNESGDENELHNSQTDSEHHHSPRESGIQDKKLWGCLHRVLITPALPGSCKGGS